MARKNPPIFKTIGATYRSLSQLGEGGSGTVWRVVNDEGNQFAAKMLTPTKATATGRRRFQNELRFCERDVHPNVIRVLDHGLLQPEEAPFYVMPLYQQSFRHLLAANLDPERALLLFGQLLAGVEAAHAYGVVHRDLKPENLLHDGEEDRLVVADFGIAHFAEEDLWTAVETRDVETRDNDRLANFVYAAPEQRARGRLVDARADVYALGLMLNETFTSEVIQGTGYRTIGSVEPRLATLDELVAKMVSQSSDARPPSVLAVRQELRARLDRVLGEERLKALRAVSPEVSDIEMELAAGPTEIVDCDIDGDDLVLTFDRDVPRRWATAFRNIRSYSSFGNFIPSSFVFNGRIARLHLQSQPERAEAIHRAALRWFETAKSDYARVVREEAAKRESDERVRVDQQIEYEQKRLAAKELLRATFNRGKG